MSLADMLRNLFGHTKPCYAPEKHLEDTVAALSQARKQTMGEIIELARMDDDFGNMFEPMRIGEHRSLSR